MSEAPTFVRASLSPAACYQEAWARVKDRYWLFFGICAVGLLIGSVAPFGILLGPMMCGIYLCFRRQASGGPVAFDLLFKGFDHFAEALIASLLMFALSLVVMIPLMIVMVATFIAMGTAAHEAQAGNGFLGCGAMVAFFFAVVLISAVIGALFAFAFPLVMDRRMKGLDAVKLSFHAARANLGGLLLLAFCNALLGFAGLLCCYVGAFLVLPITLGAHWICYERVFGIQGEASPSVQE